MTLCDAEHPTVISMYTVIAARVPSRPTGIKVNPFFFKNIMNIHWTCLLPHQRALCVLRYEDRRPQAGEEHPKGVGEGPQGHKEEEGVQQDQLCTSQATPCPRASKTPCAWTTHRDGAGAHRAHGHVPCPRDPRAHGPNLPRAHGLIRMGGCDPQSEPLFTYFDPKTI